MCKAEIVLSIYVFFIYVEDPRCHFIHDKLQAGSNSKFICMKYIQDFSINNQTNNFVMKNMVETFRDDKKYLNPTCFLNLLKTIINKLIEMQDGIKQIKQFLF